MTRITDFIAIGILAIVLAIVYSFGYYLGSSAAEIQVQQLQLKNRQLQHQNDSLQFEIDVLELELRADGETCGL